MGTGKKKQTGLFGNLSNSDDSEKDSEESSEEENSQEEIPSEKKKSLKKKTLKKKVPIFSDKGDKNPFANSSLFSGGSIFSNLETQEKSNSGGLFSSSLSQTINKSSLFANSSLFGNSNSSLFSNENKNNVEEEGEGEDEQKPSTPTQYDPLVTSKDSIYKKEFVKEIDSFFELTKVENEEKKTTENKYVNKGRGFLSLEYTEKEEKTALIVYRNTIGSKITEGILNDKVNKFEKYVKNMKNVVQICYLKKDENNKL